MKKPIFIAALFGITTILSGCGSKDYSIFDKTEGPGQVTYLVRVEPGISQSKAESIANELKDKNKSTMVNIYDGERSVDNMIYSCYDGSCTDTAPDR